MPKNNASLVWSSEQGDLRKKGSAPVVLTSLPPARQNILLARESKGRGGKAVTLIRNLVLSPDDLSALLKSLKQACGTGGTLKDGVIEMQGEQREKIAQLLREAGFKVKVAGG